MASQVDSKRLGEMMQRVLAELKLLGEPMRASELLARTAPQLDLNEHEAAVLEKSGYPRWYALIQWFSVDAQKPGISESRAVGGH